MSDTQGNNPPPRENRGGNRNRQRSRNDNRSPRRGDNKSGEPRRDDHRSSKPRRENRREDRRPRSDIERVGNNPRRSQSGAKPGGPAKLTFGQKLLRILTFGLVKPGAAKLRPPHQEAPPRPPRPGNKEPNRPQREPRQAAPIPPADPSAVDTERLHVGNLSYDASESDLADLFNGIGKVAGADIVYNGRTHRSKGFGFVQMMSITDARRAVAELHGKPFMGRPLILGPARSRGRDDREKDDDDA